LPPAITSLLHAGLLRVREFYADWRVAAWGMDAHIQRLIESKATQQDAQPQSRLFHPSLKQRLAVLQNPAGLFHVPPDLALTVGFLLGFVVSGLDTLAFKILAILDRLKAIAYAVTDAMNIYSICQLRQE
jgi:hypothetical protein